MSYETGRDESSSTRASQRQIHTHRKPVAEYKHSHTHAHTRTITRTYTHTRTDAHAHTRADAELQRLARELNTLSVDAAASPRVVCLLRAVHRVCL